MCNSNMVWSWCNFEQYIFRSILLCKLLETGKKHFPEMAGNFAVIYSFCIISKNYKNVPLLWFFRIRYLKNNFFSFSKNIYDYGLNTKLFVDYCYFFSNSISFIYLRVRNILNIWFLGKKVRKIYTGLYILFVIVFSVETSQFRDLKWVNTISCLWLTKIFTNC